MGFLSNSVLLSLENQTNGVNRIVNFTNSYLFFPVRVWMTHTQDDFISGELNRNTFYQAT